MKLCQLARGREFDEVQYSVITPNKGKMPTEMRNGVPLTIFDFSLISLHQN